MPSPHSKNPEVRLRDILENIQAIREFTAGMDSDQLAADRRTLYAVIRALEIISEATRRLPTEYKDRHAKIDWVAIAAAGNIYRHEYEGVDEKLIWHTIQHDLAPLEAVVNSELEFAAEAGRQGLAVASSEHAKEEQDFIDSISDWPEKPPSR
jgi:uncharacterized protein with HEPN domain